MVYFSRFGKLFELVADDIVVNYGLGTTVLREVALRNVVTENVRLVTGTELALYDRVQ